MNDNRQAELTNRLRGFKLSPAEPYFWYEKVDEMPGHDFTRELIKPSKEWPEGVVCIRVDDDFWSMAALPWEYRRLPLAVVVEILWPEIEKPILCADHGSWEEWWQNYHPLQDAEMFIRTCIYMLRYGKNDLRNSPSFRWRWAYWHQTSRHCVRDRILRKKYGEPHHAK